MAGNTVRLHRVFKAPAARLYRAFLDPAALAKWLPPHGFTATVEEMDARVGGRFRMTFTNFSQGVATPLVASIWNWCPTSVCATRTVSTTRTCPAKSW